jgi:hypothetical protein
LPGRQLYLIEPESKGPDRGTDSGVPRWATPDARHSHFVHRSIVSADGLCACLALLVVNLTIMTKRRRVSLE